MFRPSLKRSKMEQITLSTYAPQPPHHHHHLSSSSNNKMISKHKSFDIDQNIIFPTSLFRDKLEAQQNCVFNPLNYEWTQYPSQIKKSLNEAYQQEAGRAIGSYQNLVWYYKQNKLYIWQSKSKQMFEYQIQKSVECLQIGQIQNSCLHFKTRNLFILAVGVANQLFLFGIEKQTFRMCELNFRYCIVNSRYIQKIKFVNYNQIIVASDTSHFSHLDFTSHTNISHKKLNLVEKALPFLPLVYPTSNTFVEQLFLVSNTLYALIRQQKPANWLGVRAKKTLNYMLLKDQQIEYIIERKRIEVYELNRANNQIRLLHKIGEQQFKRKLKEKHPHVALTQDPKGLNISSIYIDQAQHSNSKYLSVVTNCGYFVSITRTDNITIGLRILKAPKQNNIGIVGIYLQKKGVEVESETKDNQVRISLGLNNLTLMNNCLWYLSERAIEAVKCDRLEGGDIIQIRKQNTGDHKWLVFTRLGFYTVTRFTARQVFLSYLLAKNQISFNSFEQAKYQTNFNHFLQNIGKAIGYQKICQALIDCLLHRNKELKVAKPLLGMVEEELKGCINKDYRDWGYCLSRNGQTQRIDVDKQSEDIWKYLIELQFKLPKKEFVRFSSQNVTCSAYWYALRNIFTKYSSFLLKVQPNNIKQNKSKIDDNILFLQGLLKFFFLKNEKQKQYFKQSMACRNKQNKQLGTKSMISNLRPLVSFSQKQREQKTQASIDQSATPLPERKHANESSSKLQEIISRSIRRLKDLIGVLMYMVDISESEGIGCLESIINSRKERIKISRLLINRVEDIAKLKQFSALLPELELQKPLLLNQWIQHHRLHNNLLPNLPQLAMLINSDHFPKIKQLFGERLDVQMDVVLLYWDNLQKEIDQIGRQQSLVSKQRQVFLEERKMVEEQNKQYIRCQMIAIESEARLIFNTVINKYANSSRDQYEKAEFIINNTIRIITSHQDTNLIYYAEQQMVKLGLSEKVIFLKKYMTKIEKPLSSSQILNNRKLREPEDVVDRQFLCSFDLISTQEQ